MRLSPEQFLTVIDNAPLVSIDLIIRNPSRAILMGRRINEPAKGAWFVPGVGVTIMQAEYQMVYEMPQVQWPNVWKRRLLHY